MPGSLPHANKGGDKQREKTREDKEQGGRWRPGGDTGKRKRCKWETQEGVDNYSLYLEFYWFIFLQTCLAPSAFFL